MGVSLPGDQTWSDTNQQTYHQEEAALSAKIGVARSDNFAYLSRNTCPSEEYLNAKNLTCVIKKENKVVHLQRENSPIISCWVVYNELNANPKTKV